MKFPTGGKSSFGDKPASAFSKWWKRVSRSGVNPEPTVKVRMEESKTVLPRSGILPHAWLFACGQLSDSIALILVTVL